MVFARSNPENALRFSRVAGTAHWSPGELPDGMEPGVSETAQWSPPELEPPNDADQINTSLTYGFVFDFCGVEVERATGRVRIDKYVTLHDAGKLLNPMLVEGQILGSFAWGMGAALLEEFVYSEDGSFLSGTFADYLCPTAPEVPEPVILHMESPSPLTPLGAKGVGEGNCMSTPVCIANAVADAIGVKDLRLPLSPSKVSALLALEEPPPPEGMAAPAPVDEGGLRGSGDALVPAPPDEIWRLLLDPEALAKVIPGCHALDRVGENEYTADISIGVGAVRGRFSAEIRLSDLEPPKGVTLSGGLTGPLGASRGEGRVLLSAEDGATRIAYTYRVEISGKVAAIGGRMLEGAARVLIRQFFQRLAAQLDGGDAGGGWWRRILVMLGFGR